jgi:hypothetical protein
MTTKHRSPCGERCFGFRKLIHLGLVTSAAARESSTLWTTLLVTLTALQLTETGWIWLKRKLRYRRAAFAARPVALKHLSLWAVTASS